MKKSNILLMLTSVLVIVFLHPYPDIYHPEEKIKHNIEIIMSTQLSLIISSLEHNKTIDEMMNSQESPPKLRNPPDKTKESSKHISKRDKALEMYFTRKMKPKTIARKLRLSLETINRDADQVKRDLKRFLCTFSACRKEEDKSQAVDKARVKAVIKE